MVTAVNAYPPGKKRYLIQKPVNLKVILFGKKQPAYHVPAV